VNRISVAQELASDTWVQVYRVEVTNSGTFQELSWAPVSCTLPTVEQPLRQREFDDLFVAAVVSVQRIDPVTTRLQLRTEPCLAGRAAELAARETGCCSFFTFALVLSRDQLSLDISVPAAHREVLDALTARARSLMPVVRK
jgi:hypothetical protein